MKTNAIYTTLHYTTLPYTTLEYNTIQYKTTQRSTIQQRPSPQLPLAGRDARRARAGCWSRPGRTRTGSKPCTSH
eukprot:11191906-Lingulodinium_polyedra.AAC.1